MPTPPPVQPDLADDSTIAPQWPPREPVTTGELKTMAASVILGVEFSPPAPPRNPAATQPPATMPVVQPSLTRSRPPLALDQVPGPAVARETRSRRRVAFMLAGFVVLLAGGALATMALLASHTTTHRAGPPVVVRTQHTLLVTIDAAGSSDLGVLLAQDPSDASASMTLLPTRLLATVPGRGTLALGVAFASSDPEIGQVAVADLLGVLVDGSWRLQDGAFQRLVDQVGGVTVDVDVDVISGKAVVLRAGAGQHLTGAQALSFASYLGPDEDEALRMGRLRQVLTAVLAALPQAAAQQADLLGSLGAGSQVSGVQLSDFLGHYVAAQRPEASILPVLPIDTGGGTVSYRPDVPAVQAYVSRLLSGSVPAATGKPAVRVFIYNGVGTPNLGALIRPKLVADGLTLVGSQNEATFDRVQTLVLIPDSSQAARAAGDRVAKVLGLPAGRVRIGNASTVVADVLVLAGSDLRL